MSENSNTGQSENLTGDASRSIHIHAPHALVDEILAAFGVPMPAAADVDTITIAVDHSALINAATIDDEK